MKRKIIFLLFLLCFAFGFSQEKSAVDAYVEYFNLPRETLFLHTNKTTFLPGEEVWFKVYAYDRKSQLTSKATTNIHIGIYDKNGKQIDQKLFLAKDGFADGNIAIDSSFASGDYYLRASTNWMKNFKEDDAFIKKIKVLNPDSEEEKLSIQTKEYDIQFLPEGGHLLVEAKNVIGVKILDNTGKGAPASGVIVDMNGNEVATFKSNFMGLGKFSFTPLERYSYKALVTLSNSNEVELDFPKVEDRGISMQVNNLSPKDVLITFSTNTATFDQILDHGQYTLVIHKDGLTKVIPMEFKTVEEKIIIAKDVLFKGVNTVTLFDKNQKPLVERMFFNAANMKDHHISLQRTESLGDSISYKFIAGLTENTMLHASVSVLPKGTKSYKPRHNILSAFYLKPYLKGHIENPSYYFTDVNRRKQYELDVLLLTQGWSRYDWDDIFRGIPQMNYTFNNGLTLRGTLNDDLNTTSELMLFPSTLDKSRNIQYDKDGKFEIGNFMPIKGESLIFTAVSEKGKTKKPGLALSFPKPQEKESINVDAYQNFESFYSNKNSALTGFVTSKREILDEVVIKAQRKKEKRKAYNLNSSGQLHSVTTELNQKYINLGVFLTTKGFDINGAHLLPSRNPVVFFLNNVQQRGGGILLSRPLFEFEDIYINTDLNANLVSLDGNVATFVSVVKLYTRRTPFSFNNARSPYENAIKVTYGFEKTKTFYTPKYGGFDTELFQDLGVIHWTPDFVISSNEIQSIQTVDTGLSDVVFYIEGITSNGDLISQILPVESSEKP